MPLRLCLGCFLALLLTLFGLFMSAVDEHTGQGHERAEDGYEALNVLVTGNQPNAAADAQQRNGGGNELAPCLRADVAKNNGCFEALTVLLLAFGHCDDAISTIRGNPAVMFQNARRRQWPLK